MLRRGKRQPKGAKRTAKRCGRYATVKTVRVKLTKAGAGTLKLGVLRPGRYRITVTPGAGRPATVSFRVR